MGSVKSFNRVYTRGQSMTSVKSFNRVMVTPGGRHGVMWSIIIMVWYNRNRVY